jgi:hypothetical protein
LYKNLKQILYKILHRVTRPLGNNSILGYKVSKCIITELRKSLKNKDEVENFSTSEILLSHNVFGTIAYTKKNSLEVIF